MKTMRKSLVATATALTVSFAGVSVATAQEEGNTENTVTATETDTTVTATVTETSEPENGSAELSSEGSSDMEADEIRDWIAVFTAVIGALSTLWTFLNRLD